MNGPGLNPVLIGGAAEQEARKLAGLEGQREDELAGVKLRQATITAYDSGTGTATITLGGDSTPIVGVRSLGSYTPTTGDTGVWALMLGTSPLLIGAVGSTAASDILVGSVGVGVNTGSATWSASVSFSPAFPSTPHVIVSHDQATAGSKTVVASAASITTSGFTAWIRSADSAAFGGSATYTVHWIAKVP